MILSNLHTHTVYSDGKQTIEENIIEAIKKGFDSIGFSDHGFTGFDSSYCIKKENQDLYKNEILSLKKKYQDKIEVYYGYELDVTGEATDKENLDFSIGSYHYVKTPDGYKTIDECKETHFALLKNYFDSDPNRLAKSYYEDLVPLVTALKPDILGHFDLVTKYGSMDEESPLYRKCALEALIGCLEKVELIEVNTGAISRGHRSVFYPSPYFLDELRIHGAKLILSSDSHDKINLDASFDFAIEVLKSHGFKSAVALKGGKFEEYAL